CTIAHTLASKPKHEETIAWRGASCVCKATVSRFRIIRYFSDLI
ncbi:MAG: hypothetical protein K0R28_4837, partial [Paenibacillus sp.]|nr:hypothetical protein [Paenibacillus sp.]